MTRTQRAALQAAAAALVLIGGLGLVAGFGVVPSLVAGLVCGAIGGLLLLGAAGRAGTALDDPHAPGTAPENLTDTSSEDADRG